MIYIERRAVFSAAHRLINPNWSDEKNAEVFGHCANRYSHGHNFQLIVTVKGEVNPDTGFVMNLADLKDLIHEHVIQHVDHRNLNDDVPFMQGIMPSTENLAMAIWKQLDAPIAEHGAALHRIRIIETENNFVEYFGEGN